MARSGQGKQVAGTGGGTVVEDDGPMLGGALEGSARAGYGDAAQVSAMEPIDPVVGRRRRGWAGSGGRWWVWVGRAILWAALIVILVNGVRAPFERFTAKPATPSAPSQGQQSQYPSGAASAFAMQFASVYLNFDQKDPASRAAQLSYFLPNNSDPQFGWDGGGALAVQNIQVAGVDVRDGNNGVVTLLIKAVAPRWLQLAVPVYAQGGKLTISGKPALLPPPPHADLPQPAARDNDTDLVNQLSATLQGFFTAYGSGATQDLSRYSLPGGSVPPNGLQGTVGFVQLGDVVAPKGPADQRVLTVTVTWSLANAKLDQTYQVSVVKKDGTWYVKDVQGATP